MPAPGQKEILRLFYKNIEVKKSEIVTAFGGNYYHNPEKYIGERLGRMVKAGILDRVRPGVYVLSKTPKTKSGKPAPTNDENQLTLF